MEASRQLEEWGRIRAEIPDFDEMFVMAAAPGEGDDSVEIHLEPREWMMLCYLRGQRSANELIELTGYGDFEAARILYGMYSAGLIDKVGAPDG